MLWSFSKIEFQPALGNFHYPNVGLYPEIIDNQFYIHAVFFPFLISSSSNDSKNSPATVNYHLRPEWTKTMKYIWQFTSTEHLALGIKLTEINYVPIHWRDIVRYYDLSYRIYVIRPDLAQTLKSSSSTSELTPTSLLYLFLHFL